MGTDGIRLKSAQRVLNDMTGRAFWQRLLRLLREERRNDGTAVWRNGADGTKIKKWRQKCKKCVWRFSTFGVFRRLWSWRRRQTGVDIFFVKRIRDSEICYFCVASFGFVAVAVIHGALMMMLLKTFLLASYKHGIFSQKSESSGQSYYSSMIVNYDSRGVPD